MDDENGQELMEELLKKPNWSSFEEWILDGAVHGLDDITKPIIESLKELSSETRDAIDLTELAEVLVKKAAEIAKKAILEQESFIENEDIDPQYH